MTEDVKDADREFVEHRVRHAVGISALRRIGRIVAAEQRADDEKAAVLRWLLRYGWIIALCALILFAYLMGVI